MTKEEAKQKYKVGEIQIYCDVENIELLRYVIESKDGILFLNHFYRTVDGIKLAYDTANCHKPTVNLSEIEDEVVWLGSEMQFFKNGKWIDCEFDKYRLKPKPNYTSEIEALQAKAKENGMKAVITFEKL